MPADLRELLERTAASPTTPVDPTRIASRSRRRTLRRRGGAGLTGVALVALLATVAWPGVVPGDGLIIEDRAADQPEVPVLDLPEGWVQVQVGDAVFGIPAELEVVEVDADDPLPCDDSGNRAYLATESYPVATRDAAGNEYACNAAGNTAPQLFAAPLSAVPAAHLGTDVQWNPRPIGDLDGEWRLGKVAPPADTPTGTDDDGADATDDGLADRTAWYRVPAVDLYLRFVTTEEDVDLVEATLATIAPLDTASAEAPNDTAEEPTETNPATGGGPKLDLPEGWTQVTISEATFGVPTDLETLELAPTDGPSCHNGIDGVRTYLAPDGYPTGVMQDRDPGGVPTENLGCRYRLAHYASLLAAPLGTVPEHVREQQNADGQGFVPVRTAVTIPGGLRGERTTVGDHLVTYAIPQVDLWLEFHNPQADPELVDQVLATITPARPLEDTSEPDTPDADEPDAAGRGGGEPDQATAETAIYTETWIRPDGEPAETEDSFEVISQPGLAHCQWESAVVLTISWPPGTSIQRVGGDGEVRKYVRDPDGVIDQTFARKLETGTTLPDDATFTGYRTEELELWLGKDGGAEGVFIVGDDRTEWWPQGDRGCM